MLEELKTPRTRKAVRRPSGLCHIVGAESIWCVRRERLRGLERSVKRVMAEPKSLSRLLDLVAKGQREIPTAKHLALLWDSERRAGEWLKTCRTLEWLEGCYL